MSDALSAQLARIQARSAEIRKQASDHTGAAYTAPAAVKPSAATARAQIEGKTTSPRKTNKTSLQHKKGSSSGKSIGRTAGLSSITEDHVGATLRALAQPKIHPASRQTAAPAPRVETTANPRSFLVAQEQRRQQAHVKASKSSLLQKLQTKKLHEAVVKKKQQKATVRATHATPIAAAAEGDGVFTSHAPTNSSSSSINSSISSISSISSSISIHSTPVRTPSDTSRMMVNSGHDADLVDDREAKGLRTLRVSQQTLEKANALCAKFESGLEAEEQRLERAVAGACLGTEIQKMVERRDKLQAQLEAKQAKELAASAASAFAVAAFAADDAAAETAAAVAAAASLAEAAAAASSEGAAVVASDNRMDDSQYSDFDVMPVPSTPTRPGKAIDIAGDYEHVATADGGPGSSFGLGGTILDRHQVIVTKSITTDSKYFWTNSARESWTLTSTNDPAVFLVGQDCPHYQQGYTHAAIIINDGSVEITGPLNEMFAAVTGQVPLSPTPGESTEGDVITQDAHGQLRRDMMVLYSYDPEVDSPNADPENELELVEGEMITILGRPGEDQFCLAEKVVRGHVVYGLVPATFLRTATPEDVEINHSMRTTRNALNSTNLASTKPRQLGSIMFTMTAKSGKQFEPVRDLSHNPQIRKVIKTLRKKYPHLHFERATKKVPYGSHMPTVETFVVNGEQVRMRPKASLVLVRDGNSWTEVMRYFQRFAKEQEIAQILEDTADPSSGEINLEIAQSLGMSGAQAAMLSLTKRMPHSVAPTPGLKMQPAKQVDLDVDISVALANLQRTHPDITIEEGRASKVTSGKRFRTRTINGEVCLLGKRHGEISVKTKEGWRGLDEYVAQQQPRLRKRDLLRTAWTTRRKEGSSSTPGHDLGRTRNVRSPEVQATLRRTASPVFILSSSPTHNLDHSAVSDESNSMAATAIASPPSKPTLSPWRSRMYTSDDAELVALRRQQEDARARQQALLTSMMKTNTEMVALLGVAA